MLNYAMHSVYKVYFDCIYQFLTRTRPSTTASNATYYNSSDNEAFTHAETIALEIKERPVDNLTSTSQPGPSQDSHDDSPPEPQEDSYDVHGCGHDHSEDGVVHSPGTDLTGPHNDGDSGKADLPGSPQQQRHIASICDAEERHGNIGDGHINRQDRLLTSLDHHHVVHACSWKPEQRRCRCPGFSQITGVRGRRRLHQMLPNCPTTTSGDFWSISERINDTWLVAVSSGSCGQWNVCNPNVCKLQPVETHPEGELVEMSRLQGEDSDQGRLKGCDPTEGTLKAHCTERSDTCRPFFNAEPLEKNISSLPCQTIEYAKRSELENQHTLSIDEVIY